MGNTDKLLELIARRSKEQLSDKLTAVKRKSQQDLLSSGCNLISLQTTLCLLLSILSYTNNLAYDGKYTNNFFVYG